MNDVQLDPIFNLQTVPPIPAGKSLDDQSTILTEVSIETARPIILTQDPQKAGDPRSNYVYLPSTASITVQADEVTVCGKLSFPGRDVVIVTRVLGAEDDGPNPATISVDGAPLPEELAEPTALKRGESPKLRDGTPDPLNPKVQQGQTDWSPRDHPEMNGENGNDGHQGNQAGTVWIYCEKTSFAGAEHKLTITARGGPGGNGQDGQAAADGGNGMDGKSVDDPGFRRQPEPGHNGGDGGDGGPGGQAGQGGNGGSITFHCRAAQPATAINYDGGDAGAVGQGGKFGAKGKGGLGGKGGEVPDEYSSGFGPPGYEHVGDAPNGHDGQDGHTGNPGLKANPSLPGESSVTWGDVKSADLVRIASVTQLQMLFERTRADYLVTDPPNYALRLMPVTDLVDSGTNLVVLALSGDGLHVRIFDASGQIVVDKGETEMINDLQRFQMSMADVLEAGNWVPAEQLQAMSAGDQRQALVDQLSRISNLPKDEINKLNDYDLIGRAAVTAFLLQMGIRDEAGLKGDLEGHRNTLIVEVAGKTGYGGLQGLDNQKLVRIALEPKPENKFVVRCGMVLLRDRLFGTEKIVPLKRRLEMSMADVLEAGNWLTQDQLHAMSVQDQHQALVDQLSRIGNLPKDEISNRNDYELIGHGAVITFLLQMGIRDEAGLKCDPADPNKTVNTLEGHRNTLIVEIGGHTGLTGPDLWPLDNQKLVRVALEPKPENKFVVRCGMVLLRDRLYNLPLDLYESKSGELTKDPDDDALPARARVIARAAEVANYTDMWGSIGDRLDWLVRLLKAASTENPLDPKQEHPQKALAKTILPSAWSAINSHVYGLDYYGHTPRFVPMLSVDAYSTAFDKSVTLLGGEEGKGEGIEGQQKDYFAAWNDQKAATKNLQNVLDSVKGHSDFLSDRIGKLGTELRKTKTSIDNHQPNPNTIQDLKKALKDYEIQLKGAFGLSVDTFFSCLSQLGFANFSEPGKAIETLSKVGGYAGAGAMVAGPVGTMLNEAVNNVLNDYGQPVNKNLLLQQIDVIQGDLDLKSQLEERSDGFISDTESKRLVVELSKFNDLCKDFHKSLPSGLYDNLDAYIEGITTRNRYIDYYNALTRDLLDLLGDSKKIEIQKDVVSSQLTKTSNPGLPVMATFVSALFERAKAECLSDFYLAARAYSFWALEPYSAFYDSIRSPGAITSVQLKAAQGDFTDLILTRLENGFGRGSFTPPREDSEASIGIVVVLAKESHPDFFDVLTSENHSDFELEPATLASTEPLAYAPTVAAWSGSTRPKFTPSTPNPFHGKANVRLIKARPWVVGMQTDSGYHTVTLVHLGEEQFRRSDDVPYPARTDEDKPEYVCHSTTEIPFTYDSTGLSWDPVKNTFTPGKLFAPGVAGATDGDVGFPQPGANVSESTFAAIGPFAKWRVIVSTEDNTGLKWDKVQAIVIDFHVFVEGFKHTPA